MFFRIFPTAILTSTLLFAPAIAKAATLLTQSNSPALSVTLTESLPLPVNRDLAQQLQTALDRSLVDIPGASVAIISPKGTWLGASGVADLATGSPLQSSDRFTYIELINSVSDRNLAGATLTTLRGYESPKSVPESRITPGLLLLIIIGLIPILCEVANEFSPTRQSLMGETRKTALATLNLRITLRGGENPVPSLLAGRVRVGFYPPAIILNWYNFEAYTGTMER